MSFSNFHFPYSFDTSQSNVIDEFFVPVLSEAITYDVFSAYFTSAWIRDAATGIAKFAANGGKSRWVINPSINELDWEALNHADTSDKKFDLITEGLIEDIEKLTQELEENTRQVIAWMIKDRILEFKIAVPKNELSGEFHPKLGIFKDHDGNLIYFNGSYNSTSRANTNWEDFEVFTSSKDPGRIKEKQEKFKKLWKGEDQNLDIYSPPEIIIEKFMSFTEGGDRPYPKIKVKGKTGSPAVPDYFLDTQQKLRAHQEKALEQWFKNNGQGIFNMATGSGKTVTALAGAARLFDLVSKKKSKFVVVVTVPYRHLATQWYTEAKAFKFDPVMCYGDYVDWPTQFSEAITDITQGISSLLMVITVNATFSGDKFQGFLSRINTNFLLIADEMHNLGAKKIKECLPEHAQFRMGLSATPIRKHDDEGSKLLEEYFGRQVIEYGIKEAIDDGTLTEYFYYPVLVEFTNEEMAEYRELSVRIGRLFAQGCDQENSALKILLMKRARLIGGAKNKLFELKKLLQDKKQSKYNLVYVGDSKEDDVRQVDKILKMIGRDIGMKADKFTADEDTDKRKQILDDFGKGELQTIVAIKCLDEGVDVPRTENAYILASSSNPRQFIQRRGRVLRKAEGKKYAHIYDFIVVPPDQDGAGQYFESEDFSSERKLMSRELERMNEFANTAENGGEALNKVLDIKKKLNILDI